MFLDRSLVIFDLDGTLIDSLGIWSLVDSALVEELSRDHVRLSEEEAYDLRVASLSRYGEGSEAYVKYCADLKAKFDMPGTPEEIHTRRYQIAQDFLREKVVWQLGAASFVRRLHDAGVKLAIATTTRRRNVDVYSNENLAMRKEAVIYDLFSVVKTRDDVSATKPDPEVLLRILEETGTDPKDALMIEDATAGLRAAAAAGVDAIVISERHSEGERATNDALSLRRFESYEELHRLLDEEERAGLRPPVRRD